MSKIQRAIDALEECAKAIDQVPPGLRLSNPFMGMLVKSNDLRREADNLKELMDVFKEAKE